MCGTLLNLYPTIPILILCQKVMILGIIEDLFFRGFSASSFVPRLNYTLFHQYCNSVVKDLQTFILPYLHMRYNGLGGDQMLFFKKKPKPAASYTYTQAEDYKGFKRLKLSSYGHEPAEAGIRALSDTDLTGAKIKIDIFEDDYPRAVFSVGKHEVGTIWKRSFDKYTALKNGKISAVRLEIRDGESYLFYKV